MYFFNKKEHYTDINVPCWEKFSGYLIKKDLVGLPDIDKIKAQQNIATNCVFIL